MIQQMTNRELAQEISARIGNAPIPFDSVYSIALQIYQELGGEENDFDSVYSILLEILPLAESVAKKTSITDIDELPDAQDNNNIYRLSSDDKVYMSKLLSIEPTNKLPDDEQIDKAFLWESEGSYYYYNGAWKFILNDGEVNGYGWLATYPGGWNLFLTKDNEFNATRNTLYFELYSGYEFHTEIDFEKHTATIKTSISNFNWENAETLADYGIAAVVPAVYNAPESAQIGYAEIVTESDGLYTGEEITFYVMADDEHYTGYKWGNGSASCIATTKPASEIYFVKDENDIFYSDFGAYDLWYNDESGEWETEDIVEGWSISIVALNAPDSEQIGKAEIGNAMYQIDYYSGEKTVTCSDGNVTVYLWGSTDTPTDVGNAALTKIPASDIYTASVGAVYQGLAGMHWDDISTLTYDDTVQAFNDDFNTFAEDIPVPNGSILKYQRTTEWKWEEIVTKDDIPQATVIKIASTGATELAKLNDFTETGVYDSNILKLTYLGYPAQLIVGEYVQSNIKFTSQWIKYYNPIHFYSEYVYARRYNHTSKQWENNPGGEYPITIHDVE